MKRIRIPSRTVPEETSRIATITVIPSQSRLVASCENDTQFERTLTAQELTDILALVDSAVTAVYADAVVEDEPTEDITP